MSAVYEVYFFSLQNCITFVFFSTDLEFKCQNSLKYNESYTLVVPEKHVRQCEPFK